VILKTVFLLYQRNYLKLFCGMILSVILFLSACSGKQNRTLISYSKIQVSRSDEFLNILKSELPVPVGFSIVEKLSCSQDQYNSVFVYEGQAKFYEVSDFYRKNLEVCGWDLKDFSSSDEILFTCNKALRNCVISARPSKSGMQIKIFVKRNITFVGEQKIIFEAEQDINSKNIEI
jgi:hypothetical protein